MRVHSSSKRTPLASRDDRGGVATTMEVAGERSMVSTVKLRYLQWCGGGGACFNHMITGYYSSTPASEFHYAESTTTTTIMSSSERLQQVANHLSNNHARGLLNGEVAIITGAFLVSPIGAPFSRLTFRRRCSGIIHRCSCYSLPSQSRSLYSYRVSVEARPSFLLGRAQRLSSASKYT